MAPDHRHLFRDRADEGRIVAIERGKEERGKGWSGPIRYGVLNGLGRLSMGFGNAIEGEKSAQRLVELVWWGSAVADGTIEDHDGGSSSARGRIPWEILKTI